MSEEIGTLKGHIGLDHTEFDQGMAATLKSIEQLMRSANESAKEVAGMGEAAGGLEVLKMGMEAVAKVGEFMKQGLEGAASLGNKPAQELMETLEHVGLASRQLGADLMSNLAPAFNGLISYFTRGADLGKILSTVAGFIGEAFRATVEPIVAVAGAIKGLIEGGTFESAMKGAADAAAELAKHGANFAGSLETAAEMAETLANLQKVNTEINIGRQANRMQEQYTNLTGNRRQDQFAGAMTSFPSFMDALNAWKRNMTEAAELTAQAAVEDAHKNQVGAASLRTQADQATQAADAAMLAADGWRASKEKLIVDAAAINKVQLQLADTMKGTALTSGIRTQQYSNTYDPTKGFKDFDDALARQTQALDNQAGLIAAANVIQQQAGPTAQATVDALNAQAAAESRAATAAGAAADAFFAVKDRLKDQLSSALQTLGEGLLSNLGQFGKTVSDVIKGAQQGGIWGALAAAIMDLLAQIKGWTRIQDIAQGQMKQLLQSLGSGLNSIINALHPLMGALGMLTNSVGGILNPILGVIGTILKGIAPLFATLAVSLRVLGGTLGPLLQIVGGILEPLFKLLAAVLSPLVLIFMALKVAVDYVSVAFNTFVDWVDHITGGNNQGGINDAQNQLNQDMATMSSFAQDFANHPFDALNNLETNSANAAEALGRTADAANSVTQQLLNVPSGIKVAAYAYSASNGTGAPQGGSASGAYTGMTSGAMRQRFLGLGTTVDPSRYPKKKP